MPINTRAAAMAGAATAAIIWTLCSVAVALGLASSPAAVFSNLFHLGMTGSPMPAGSMMGGGSMMAFSVTLGGFFIGLIAWSVIFGLIGAIFGASYNRSVK